MLTELDPKQREAVEHGEGPLLIVAGPGSGKTSTIVHRVAHLVTARNVPPDKILVTTFTKNAAEEMRTRLRALIGEASDTIWLGTVHSRCLEVLRAGNNAPLVGLQAGFTTIAEADAKRLIEQIARQEAIAYLGKETNLEADEEIFGGRTGFSNTKANPIDTAILKLGLAAMPSRIAYAKEQNKTPEDVMREDGWTDSAARVYRLYNEHLRKSNRVDFGDMQMLTVRILHEMPNVLAWIRQRFQFVLVDEYQDTNAVQAELFNLICDQHRNITVVGDVDQSVYGWRGADPKFMLDFKATWPDAKVVYLDRNYRSSETIVKAAQALISNNTDRFSDFEPSAVRHGGERPKTIIVEDQKEEAKVVAAAIEDFVRRAKVPFREIAVLYRTHRQSRLLESELLRQQIPHTILGGMPFFARKEVQDMLAWLRLVVNRKDDDSFRRAVMAPPRWIGKTTLERLEAYGQPLLETAANVVSSDILASRLHISNPQRNRLREIAELCSDYEWQLHAPNLMAHLANATGYLDWLATQDDGRTRMENVAELCTLYTEFDETRKAERTGLGEPKNKPIEFLDWVTTEMENAGRRQNRTSASSDVVSLMTMHTAKGTEFDVVFVVGCAEGITPAWFAIHPHDPVGYSESEEENKKALEEERRLFYVAMTRARKHLRLLVPLKRSLSVPKPDGSTKSAWHPCKPSRFIYEASNYDNGKLLIHWHRTGESNR
jgi:DNA helicase-2/ATP-dependent DNA helicase PcrA